ncbi:MAG: hypothetical protein DI536_19650 [Archangium gephyra]|uniref:DUF3592 domain-containing protein n=1 Tax=Archangium gephyra TaxID=48 RepID=A0A2W5VJ92_9BACT|nr:MAG: hypothetical protein DI536_19650 [Archangium gephyra]
MTAQRIGTAVFGLIGIASAIGATAFFVWHFSFFSRAVETQAKTTSVQKLVDQNREAFEVTGYQFSDADGGVHFGSINGTISGEHFTLWYDPQDLTDTRRSRVPWVGLLFSAFAVVFGGIAVSQAFKKR